MMLSFTFMFGQSNDLFYAPKNAIALFDKTGKPIGGDITNQLVLLDAGTEVKDVFRIFVAPGVPNELYFGNTDISSENGRPKNLDYEVKYFKQ